MKWIDAKITLPELKKSVLVIAKSGFYWDKSHRVDERSIGMHVGFFYDENELYKNGKEKINFEIECGCSGAEHDREEIEVIYWVPLPETPNKI